MADLIDILSYYVAPAPMSDPRQFAPLIADLPEDVPSLVKIMQGLVVHIFWAERYGLELEEARKAEVELRPAWRKLARIMELDPHPLTETRPLERRLVGNCRDISLLMVSIMRCKGIPARARCGFGTYFLPGHYEDHWVVEYWEPDAERWVMVDAQLDDLQQEKLGIAFDPLDMPPGQFVTGGKAWWMARHNQADPEKFGIFEWHGIDFIRGNLVRDLASLNKVETKPWDMWGVMETPVEKTTPADIELHDQAARLTLRGNEAFDEVRAVYNANPDFQAPVDWAD